MTHASYQPYAVSNNTAVDVFLTPITPPIAVGGAGLFVSLSWSDAVQDLDLVAVTPCSTVNYNTRLRAIGGVSVRLDRDCTNGYGPEVRGQKNPFLFCFVFVLAADSFPFLSQNIKMLANLPCGDYELCARCLGKNTYFRSNVGVATISPLLSPNSPVISMTPSVSGDYRTWWLATLQVRLVNPSTLQRSYQLISRNIFQADLPPSNIVGQCAADVSYCRILEDLHGATAAMVAAPLLLMVALVVLIL